MKPCILTIIFISVFCFGSLAQEPTAEQRAESLTQSMCCELGLLQKQREDVKAINLKACREMDALRAKAKDNVALLNSEGAKIDMERNIELRDVLTIKQWAVYERIAEGNKRDIQKTAVCRKNLLTVY